MKLYNNKECGSKLAFVNSVGNSCCKLNLIIVVFVLIISFSCNTMKISNRKSLLHSSHKYKIIEQVPLCRELCQMINPVMGEYIFNKVTYSFDYDENKWKYTCYYVDEDNNRKVFQMYYKTKCLLNERE